MVSRFKALGFRTGEQVDVQVGRLPSAQALQPGAMQAAFRVLQEALSNAARHARASQVRVAIGSTEDGGLALEVEDNGVGFDVTAARPGLGVANMRQRAADFGGTLNVASAPGHGTAISLVLPATVTAREDYAAYRKRTAIYGMLLPSGGVFLAILARQDAMMLWFGVPIFVHWMTMFLQQLVGLRRLRSRMEAAR